MTKVVPGTLLPPSDRLVEIDYYYMAHQLNMQKNIKKFCLVLFVFTASFFHHPNESSAATYKEVKWAFGYVMGHLMVFMAYHDACSAKYPKLRADLDDALRNWGARNRSLDRVRDAFYLRARQEGGDAEARNAASHMKEALKIGAKKAREDAKKADEHACELYLISIRQGVHDYSRTLSKEIHIILGK